jgi:hypothetical protein
MKNLILLHSILFYLLNTLYSQTVTFTLESNFTDDNVYIQTYGDLVIQLESTFNDDDVYNSGNSNSAEIDDLIDNLRGATFSWYGKFLVGSTAMYTNNVNVLLFDKASGVDTAYLDISGSDGYDGRYPIDEYGELYLASQDNWGRIQIKSHSITLGGVELNIETPIFKFSNNIFNSTLSPDIAGYTYQLEEDWSIEFEAGQYPANSEVDVTSNGTSSIGDIIADSDGDNVRDSVDAFPSDSSETTDTDSDGVGDNSDAFPNDTTETIARSKLLENGYYALSEIQDLRAGSTLIEIGNGQASLSMEVEQSDDLGIWTTGGTASVQMNVQPSEDKKFFRFKITE